MGDATREVSARLRIDVALSLNEDENGVASLGVPVVALVGRGHGARLQIPDATPLAVVERPADPRQVVALVLAAAAGRLREDIRLVEVGREFSVVPGLRLVFWRDRLMRLPAAERLVFCTLVDAPGRIFRWEELVALTGGAPVSGYYYLLRIRKVLRFCGAPTDGIETFRGKGVRWCGGEMSKA